VLDLPHDAVERKQIMNKWEKFQEDHFDPNMVIGGDFIQTSLDLMPLLLRAITSGLMSSLISILLVIISLDCIFILKFIQRVSQKYPDQNLPYFEDYPMNDTYWNLYE